MDTKVETEGYRDRGWREGGGRGGAGGDKIERWEDVKEIDVRIKIETEI